MFIKTVLFTEKRAMLIFVPLIYIVDSLTRGGGRRK